MELEGLNTITQFKDLGIAGIIIIGMMFAFWKMLGFQIEHSKDQTRLMIENDKELLLAKAKLNDSVTMLNESVIKGNQIVTQALDDITSGLKDIQVSIKSIYTNEQGKKDQYELLGKLDNLILQYQDLKNILQPKQIKNETTT